MLALGLLLSGCGAILVGGAATGAAVVYDRRDAETVLSDQKIEIQVLDLKDKNPQLAEQTQISATSYNRLVLLTGQARSVDFSRRFAALVARIPGVKRVINEVQIGPDLSLAEQSSDSYLTTKVKTALFGVEIDGFEASRIKVVSHDGAVYLMGLVTQREAEIAVEEARTIGGVAKVVRVFEYIQG
jgi:osmotically-inducible protein OsmY